MHEPADGEGSLLRAEISLDALRHNVRHLLARADGAEPVGVVKADAYGHGALDVARVLREEGVVRLAVATLAEAVALRETGVDAWLLVLAAPLPGQLGAYVRHGLAVTVSSPDVAEAIAETAREVGPLVAHVKVDTGMHRLGLAPDAAPAVVRALQATPGVEVEALWTHLATADTADPAFVQTQATRFQAVVDALGDDAPPLVHVENGPAFVRGLLTEAWGDRRRLVRLGGVLYGLASAPSLVPDLAGLRPVMRLVTRVVHLQTVAAGEAVSYGQTWRAEAPTRIATLAAGYADGLPRALQQGGEVGIRGGLHPVVGRVCMDMLMTSLGAPDGPGAAVRVGDEAVLWGSGGPSAEAQASHAGTLSYELTSGLTARVPRVPVSR